MTSKQRPPFNNTHNFWVPRVIIVNRIDVFSLLVSIQILQHYSKLKLYFSFILCFVLHFLTQLKWSGAHSRGRSTRRTKMTKCIKKKTSKKNEEDEDRFLFQDKDESNEMFAQDKKNTGKIALCIFLLLKCILKLHLFTVTI